MGIPGAEGVFQREFRARGAIPSRNSAPGDRERLLSIFKSCGQRECSHGNSEHRECSSGNSGHREYSHGNSGQRECSSRNSNQREPFPVGILPQEIGKGSWGSSRAAGRVNILDGNSGQRESFLLGILPWEFGKRIPSRNSALGVWEEDSCQEFCPGSSGKAPRVGREFWRLLGMIPAELSARLFRLFPVIPAVIPATPVVIPIIPMVIPVIPMVIPIISRYPSGHSLNPGHSHPIPLHPKV